MITIIMHWFKQLYKNKKYQQGIIDPLTIGILGFLAVSFIIGSVAVVRNNFDARSRATGNMCPPYGAGPASCYGKPTGFSCGTNSTCQLSNSVCQCVYQAPQPSPTPTAYCDRTKCPNDCSRPTIDGGECNTYCKSSCPSGCAELSPTGGTCLAYCSQSCASNQECIASATGGHCQALSPCFGNLGYRCSGTVSLYCANEGQSSPDRRECSPGVCVANSERCRTNSGCEGRIGYTCDGTTSVYCQTEQTIPNYRNCGNEGRACVANINRCFSTANPYCKAECKNGCAELSVTGGTCNYYCDKTCGAGQYCKETATGGVCETIPTRVTIQPGQQCYPSQGCICNGREIGTGATCTYLCDTNICQNGCVTTPTKENDCKPFCTPLKKGECDYGCTDTPEGGSCSSCPESCINGCVQGSTRCNAYCISDRLNTNGICKFGCNPTSEGGRCKSAPSRVKIRAGINCEALQGCECVNGSDAGKSISIYDSCASSQESCTNIPNQFCTTSQACYSRGEGFCESSYANTCCRRTTLYGGSSVVFNGNSRTENWNLPVDNINDINFAPLICPENITSCSTQTTENSMPCIQNVENITDLQTRQIIYYCDESFFSMDSS